MGFKYAGWLCGMLALLGAALATAYTAKLLAKCMDLDPSIITFSDLAYISFGRNARIATSVLFTLELVASCVALIVLFADSMDLLFHGVLSINEWKILFAIILVPLNFLPLRYLSFTSVIGILCCMISKFSPIHRHPSLAVGLTSSSCPHCYCRWPRQDRLTRVFDPPGQHISLSSQLAYSASVVWPSHVAMGWSRRIPEYL